MLSQINPEIQRCSDTRVAYVADIPGIVRTHQESFPDFFLTRLGPWFLHEYYRLVLEASGGILWVAMRDEHVVGFVAGFVDTVRFYETMRAKKWRLAFPVLMRLLVYPRMIKRVLMNFRHVNHDGDQDKLHPGTAAELSSIGVDPNYAGRGIGKQLVADFLREAGRRDAAYVKLTTDAHNNASVNSFYDNLGFRLVNTFAQADGRVMNAYMLPLSAVEKELSYV
ncbi:MAG TPA: GNAT family N-acetyltransferase [Armatimonadota bacterium]|jgi:ribosomal protein S18 acetylase RimI-like enzyme